MRHSTVLKQLAAPVDATLASDFLFSIHDQTSYYGGYSNDGILTGRAVAEYLCGKCKESVNPQILDGITDSLSSQQKYIVIRELYMRLQKCFFHCATIALGEFRQTRPEQLFNHCQMRTCHHRTVIKLRGKKFKRKLDRLRSQ